MQFLNDYFSFYGQKKLSKPTWPYKEKVISLIEK